MSDGPLVPKASGSGSLAPAYAAAGAGGMAAVLGFVLGFQALGVLGAVLAFLVSGALVVRHLMRSNPHLAALDRREAEAAAEARDRERYAGLRRRLLQLRAPAVHADATRAFKQLEAALSLWRAFTSALERKFQPTEITYARYAGAGEQVFLGVMANLATLADKLAGLESLATAGTPLDPEASAGVAALLEENDRALASLAKVNAALADVRTERGELKVGLEASMAELEALAKRAHLYSNDR